MDQFNCIYAINFNYPHKRCNRTSFFSFHFISIYFSWNISIKYAIESTHKKDHQKQQQTSFFCWLDSILWVSCVKSVWHKYEFECNNNFFMKKKNEWKLNKPDSSWGSYRIQFSIKELIKVKKRLTIVYFVCLQYDLLNETWEMMGKMLPQAQTAGRVKTMIFRNLISREQ